MLNDTQRFRCPANVAARVMDGEAIMIHLESGKYFSAEGIGGIVWQLLDSGVAFGDIVASVSNHFGIAEVQARIDLDRFVTELVTQALLVGDEPTAIADTHLAPGFEMTEYSTPTLHAYHDMADLLALDPPMPSLKPME